MKTVLIVGITRSGLTLTMQMLDRGGYPCFGNYPAYEEYEIGKLPFSENIGKAIKVIDTNRQMPPKGDYYVIRLRRNYRQQARSIAKFMNIVCGIPKYTIDVGAIEKSLHSDYKKIDDWAKKQTALMILDFEELITEPQRSAMNISSFLSHPLDIDKMVDVVISRNTDCYPEMLETRFL